MQCALNSPRSVFGINDAVELFWRGGGRRGFGFALDLPLASRLCRAIAPSPGTMKEPDAHAIAPIYIRLPKWGARCPHSELTRIALDQLTRPQPINKFRPPVKSKMFKMAGQKSGIKLIDFASSREYLDNLPDVQ